MPNLDPSRRSAAGRFSGTQQPATICNCPQSSAAMSKTDGTSTAGLLAPVYFKHAVDAMGQGAVQMTVAALLTSGLCRIVNGVAKEIQHPCFTPISQVSNCSKFKFIDNT